MVSSSCDLQLGLGLAGALAQVGRIQDAVQQYTFIADALEARGERMLALSTWRLTGSVAPYCVQTQLRCADAYSRAGQLGDAIAIWDWAAGVLAGHGRHLEAADVLARAVEAAPDALERRRGLGELYARLGMIDAAVDHLDAVARGLWDAGYTALYVEVAERILGLRRDHVPTLRGLSRVHLQARDFGRLVARVRSLLGGSRGDPVAGELIVEAFLATGHLHAAREAAVTVGSSLVARDDAFAHEVARRLVERVRRSFPTDARLRALHEELEAEPIEDVSIVEDVDALPSDREASAQTGVIDYHSASIALRPKNPNEDGETNVFSLASVRGAVIEGRFRRATG